MRAKKQSISLVFLRVLPAQAPEGKAQATVGVQAEGNLSGGVELTLEFYGAAQGAGGSMRHLEESIQHTPSADNGPLTPTDSAARSYVCHRGTFKL